MLQNNLGLVLEERAAAGDLDDAIRCFNAAAEVYTRDDFPREWKLLQGNLARTISRRVVQDRSGNVDEALAR